MLFLLIITLLALTNGRLVFTEEDYNPLSEEFINLINKQQSSWRAGRNFDPKTSISQLKRLCGVHPSQSKDEEEPWPVKKFHISALRDLPEHFDARDHWPNCETLKQVKDQTNCASDWAVAGTHAMTDRICIASNGSDSRSVSAGDLLACCKTFCGYGCDGVSSIGFLWKYWCKYGIATGGDYGTSNGCVAYQFPFCAHVPNSKYSSCGPKRKTPTCTRKCDSDKLNYEDEIIYAESMYRLYDEGSIKQEIFDHGPVEGVMSLHEDFVNYKSGIYHYQTGKHIAHHAVKIIGWGVENGEKYWLCANSWNEEWGDNGFFKIRIGDSGIETSVFAGGPRL